MLGLVTPTAGTALIDGVPYRRLRRPLQRVGAVIENAAMHPGQTGRAHLGTQAILAGGQLVRQAPLAAITESVAGAARMRCSDPGLLAGVLTAAGARLTGIGDVLEVQGMATDLIGQLARGRRGRSRADPRTA